MTYFLINKNFPDFYAKKLSAYGFCVPVPEFEALESPVSCHPDMLAAKVGEKLFIHSSHIKLNSILSKMGAGFTMSQTEVLSDYPNDIPLNFFFMNNTIFGNKAHMSREVVSFAQLYGIDIADVPQGYAKCSSMLVRDGVVTADISIYNAVREHGIDALLISPGHINIEKYDTGFIGGASGEISEGKVAVFGNIAKHPDGYKIRDFAYKHDTEIVSLGSGDLFDYGGFVRIKT
ncbi:MAG: DUF6873 family GME fold protein [Eubacteriales bacterium]